MLPFFWMGLFHTAKENHTSCRTDSDLIWNRYWHGKFLAGNSNMVFAVCFLPGRYPFALKMPQGKMSLYLTLVPEYFLRSFQEPRHESYLLIATIQTVHLAPECGIREKHTLHEDDALINCSEIMNFRKQFKDLPEPLNIYSKISSANGVWI